MIGPPDCDVRQVAVMLRTLADVKSEPGFSPVCSDALPSAIGAYTGTLTETSYGCLIPADNGVFATPIDVDITMQNNLGAFEGTAVASLGGFTVEVLVRGAIDGSGSIVGQMLSEVFFNGGFDGIALALFTGSLSGNALSVDAQGFDLVGDTCSISDTIVASR